MEVLSQGLIGTRRGVYNPFFLALDYIMECPAYNYIRTNYVEILNVDTLSNLFVEEKITRVADLLIKIHSRRTKLQKEKEA